MQVLLEPPPALSTICSHWCFPGDSLRGQYPPLLITNITRSHKRALNQARLFCPGARVTAGCGQDYSCRSENITLVDRKYLREAGSRESAPPVAFTHLPCPPSAQPRRAESLPVQCSWQEHLMSPPKTERHFPVPRCLCTPRFSLFPHPLGCNHTDISPSPGGFILGGVWVVSVYEGGCLSKFKFETCSAAAY